jgi:tetratricopeptide (TPR) repeat protein
MPFRPERFNLPENFIGDSLLKLHCTLLLFLLASPLLGVGQQDGAAKYGAVVSAAQDAMNRRDFKAAEEDYKQAVKMHPESAEMWANLGLMEHESGDYAEAIKSFQQAIRLKSSLYVPNLFIGIDSMQTGSTSAAIPFLVKAERMNKVDPEAPLELGRAYSATGNFPAAAREFTRAVELDPKQSDAWLGEGMAYLDQVEEDARKLSTGGPHSSYAQALYAESMARQSRYIEAADGFKKAIAAQPQPPCLRAEFGFMYVRQQKMQDADSEFKRESPECGVATLGEARLRIEEAGYPEALALVQELWAKDQGFVRAHASLLVEGLSQLRSAEFAEFLTQQQAFGKIDTDLYQSLNAAWNGNSAPMGAASPGARDSAQKSYAAGRYGECAAALKQNLSGRSESELLLLSACAYYSGDYALASSASEDLTGRPSHPMGGLYWSIKADQALALQSLAHFEQMAPNSVPSHVLLGDMYRQRQRYDDALTQYKLALEISPTDHAALLGLAYAYFGNANIDACIATATTALAANPSDPELNVLMGESLVARHDFVGAEPYLQKGLAAKPQMLPQVHALLGTVYAETGRTQDAIAQLEMGRIADGDGSIHYKLARMYRKSGDIKKADAAMQQVKLLEQQRRKGAVTALEDSSQPVDDLPKATP